jgi:hypothetical protein
MNYYLVFMKTRHIILRALLTLLLLASQQMAMAHAVSHFSGSHKESSGKQLPADQFCDQCLAAAQLASGATSNASLILPNAGPVVAPVADITNLFLGRTSYFFQPRAPPAI